MRSRGAHGKLVFLFLVRRHRCDASTRSIPQDRFSEAHGKSTEARPFVTNTLIQPEHQQENARRFTASARRVPRRRNNTSGCLRREGGPSSAHREHMRRRSSNRQRKSHCGHPAVVLVTQICGYRHNSVCFGVLRIDVAKHHLMRWAGPTA